MNGVQLSDALAEAFVKFEQDNDRQPKVLAVPKGLDAEARRQVSNGAFGHVDVVVDEDVKEPEFRLREPLRDAEASAADAQIADHRPESWREGEAPRYGG